MGKEEAVAIDKSMTISSTLNEKQHLRTNSDFISDTSTFTNPQEERERVKLFNNKEFLPQDSKDDSKSEQRNSLPFENEFCQPAALTNILLQQELFTPQMTKLKCKAQRYSHLLILMLTFLFMLISPPKLVGQILHSQLPHVLEQTKLKERTIYQILKRSRLVKTIKTWKIVIPT